MAITVRPVETASTLSAGRLPRNIPWVVLAVAVSVAAALFWLLAAANEADYSVGGTALVAAVIYLALITGLSAAIEGRRQATDRFVTGLVSCAFLLALVPLVSLGVTVVANGVARFDVEFFNSSMRNITGEGGGALHAMVGTLLITLAATIISVPLGLMTSIYLVEYGQGRLARLITFFVDVMTGIPSIVAGLFAFAAVQLFITTFIGEGPVQLQMVKMGLSAAIALSVLMIPVVVRSTEEMLRVVPNELREASYALGVRKWRTIVQVVLPTSVSGIASGVTLAIARVTGETAPILVTAGFIAATNWNPFSEWMTALPVFIYRQLVNPTAPSAADPSQMRAWAAALVLILIVMLLNLAARIIAKAFAPKQTGR